MILFTDSFYVHGHEIVLGTHKTTLEFTKDEDLSRKGDCITGIKSTKSFEDFNSQLKKYVNLAKKIKIKLNIDELEDEIIGWGIGANVTDERRKSYWRRQPGASRKQMQDYAISSGGYAIAVSQDDSIAKLRKDRSDAKSGSDLDWRDPQEKVFQKRAEDYLDKKSKVLEAAGKKEIAILKKAFNDYMDNLVEPLKKGELYGVSDIIDMSGRSYKTHSKESFATIRAAADRLAKIGHVFWQMRSWTSNIKNASDLKRLVFDVNKAIQG